MVICCAAAWFLAACSNEYDIPGGQTERDGNSIILDISSGALPVSRATVPAEGAEVAVSHIDVLIFNENKDKVWSDRVSAPANETGKITLAAKRESFTPVDSKYWVYLIANSTHAKRDFDDLVNLNGLRAMTQEDKNIHMTGLTGEDVDLPETFLMDGIAYPEGSTEPAPTAAAPVVLYNGTKAEDTQLAVTLRRAAAKVVVTINKGDNVTFDNSPQAHEAGYYLRNMPYTTSVIAGVDGKAKLDDTGKTSGAYFNWTAEKITVTAYMYAHAWENESLEKEVRLVMNIPMTYSKDADPQLRPSNYYQIPVCSGKVLKRNTCYMVTATVNAPGAENPSKPVTLTDVRYTVEDWKDEMIEVGGEDGRPAYLTLNEYDLEMRNMEDDNTTLIFASSSKVTSEVVTAYYFDKFGDKKTESDAILTQITATADHALTGHIKIHSPLPTNNAIRYIEVKVRNEENIERIVTIAQYPLEYITHIQGRYSYRDDFGGTTYENYGENGITRNDFFVSKAVKGETTEEGKKGLFEIRPYKWNKNSNGDYEVECDKFGGYKAGNAYMYKVVLTSTSNKYTIGIPRLNSFGYTDESADNNKLVSPSFMLASQLGTAANTDQYETVAEHCEQYVEVDKDGNIYDDWRLPTRAELEIIIEFQYKSDAMDEIIRQQGYWCADGKQVYNTQGLSGTGYFRCIRDAYDDKK